MEKPLLVKQENSPEEVKIISAEELVGKIYKGESLPQDSKFLPIDEGGVFKYFSLNNLNSFKNDRLFYVIVEINGEIVGLSELERDPYKANNYWSTFTSVDPNFRSRGYARKMIEEKFRFVKEQGCSLEISYYATEEGKRLKKIYHEYAEKFSVRLIEND